MNVLKLSQDYTNNTKRLINHVLVCAGIKEIQNMKIINTSSQALLNLQQLQEPFSWRMAKTLDEI
jgi:hypothetical protein